MRHLKLLSLLSVPSLALFFAGCGSGNRVGHTAQTITFANPGTETAGTSLMLSANASSDVAVTLTSTTPGVCTVSGTTATFVAAGTCTIDASQSGTSTYAAASQVAQSFTVNPAIGPNTTIYIAGYAISTASSPGNPVNVAEIWQLKSGSPTATATALPTPSGITSSQAGAITISGSDVYVAGTTSNGTNQTAVYWLNNGPAITLPSSKAISQTNAIAVSGGNVYIAGYEENGVANGNAVLWVNGTHTMLSPPPGKAYAGASAVMVSGGNVYVAGIAFNNDNDESAVLWVNGVPTILPPPAGLTGDYFANGLAISAGTIYVSGSTIPNVGNSTALFWVNGGAATALPIPPNDSAGNYGAGAITVSGSDVYIAGAGSNGTTGDTSAAYWMNGAATTLPMPNAFANPSDGTSSTSEIALSGSDVYAAGWLVDSTDGVAQTAAYWVNSGEATLLPMPSGTYESWASAIAVATQ
ncbi:MAG TPA: hypothetical protein VMF56_09170 [Acidobacteriaceae bacterium]|nr:hypothetical protein [Acidobacteriaceae bacterium]